MSIQAFKNILEEKHFNRLPTSRVFELANKVPDFCTHWLIHSLRSDAGIEELSLALAFADKWKLPTLNTLGNYLNSIQTNKSENLEIKHIVNKLSQQNINLNFKRAQVILEKLNTSMSQFNEHKVLADNVNLFGCALESKLHNKIISDAEPQLHDVTLVGKSNSQGVDKSIRNNFHFPNVIPNTSIELALLERHICKTANLSIANAEPPVILRYEPGQYYRWHYDFIYPHNPQIQNQIEQFGQRVNTCIYYLSDDCQGGETEFKKLNISLKPQTGNLISFNNCDSSGVRINNSLHRGTEVVKGTKWIVTLWFRTKPYWLRTGLLTN